MVKLALDGYLAELKAQEKKDPRGGREVPTVSGLAKAIGVSRGAMSNLIGGHVKHVNLELLTAIVNELRKYGFEPQLTDLFAMYPAEWIAESKAEQVEA